MNFFLFMSKQVCRNTPDFIHKLNQKYLDLLNRLNRNCQHSKDESPFVALLGEVRVARHS